MTWMPSRITALSILKKQCYNSCNTHLHFQSHNILDGLLEYKRVALPKYAHVRCRRVFIICGIFSMRKSTDSSPFRSSRLLFTAYGPGPCLQYSHVKTFCSNRLKDMLSEMIQNQFDSLIGLRSANVLFHYSTEA